MTLNRRDFIGAIAASATVGKLGLSLARATTVGDFGTGSMGAQWRDRCGRNTRALHLYCATWRTSSRWPPGERLRAERSADSTTPQSGSRSFSYSPVQGFWNGRRTSGYGGYAQGCRHRASLWHEGGHLHPVEHADVRDFFCRGAARHELDSERCRRPSDSAAVWIPTIFPVSTLFFKPGISRLFEESCSLRDRGSEDRLHPF